MWESKITITPASEELLRVIMRRAEGTATEAQAGETPLAGIAGCLATAPPHSTTRTGTADQPPKHPVLAVTVMGPTGTKRT